MPQREEKGGGVTRWKEDASGGGGGEGRSSRMREGQLFSEEERMMRVNSKSCVRVSVRGYHAPLAQQTSCHCQCLAYGFHVWSWFHPFLPLVPIPQRACRTKASPSKSGNSVSYVRNTRRHRADVAFLFRPGVAVAFKVT